MAISRARLNKALDWLTYPDQYVFIFNANPYLCMLFPLKNELYQILTTLNISQVREFLPIGLFMEVSSEVVLHKEQQ